MSFSRIWRGFPSAVLIVVAVTNRMEHLPRASCAQARIRCFLMKIAKTTHLHVDSIQREPADPRGKAVKGAADGCWAIDETQGPHLCGDLR